jgi:hypothetical protein
LYNNYGQVTLDVRLLPPSEDVEHDVYSRSTPLGWAAATLSAFEILLAHCAAVSFSVEFDHEDLVSPDPDAMPSTVVHSGSLAVTLITAEPTLWAANTLGLIAVLLKKGPDLAGLPHRVRERWYLDAAAAERAKEALEELRASLPETLEQRRRTALARREESDLDPRVRPR